MDVSREDLTQHFENLSDEELLQRLRSGTLTTLAIEVAHGILRSRGVDPMSFPGAADSTVESAVGLDGEGRCCHRANYPVSSIHFTVESIHPLPGGHRRACN